MMNPPPNTLPATRGPLLRPGDAGYDTEKSGYNRIVTHHPAMIVGAADTDDVQTAVRYARDHDTPVSVQATGHGVSVPADDAVLIATRRMDSVTIDSQQRVATIQAGVRSGALVQVAANHELAPLNGSSPDVGAVSYTLGGGLALLGRCYGYAADHVRSIDIVTADGQLRTTTADREPDLFWALRGGKGNFGVVVAMTVDLMPLSRIYGGGLWYGTNDVGDALHAYSDWTRTQPDAMASSVLLIKLPDIDGIPDPIRGRYIAHVRIAYAGPADTGTALVAPLRNATPTLLDTVDEMAYRDVGSIHNEPTQPVPFLANNTELNRLDHGAVDALLEHAGPDADAPYFVELRHLGGALNRPPSVPNAIGRRDGQFTVYTGSVVTPDTIDTASATQHDLLGAMAPWATGGLCANFLSGPHTTTADLRSGFTRRDFARLQQLKRRYDPNNMFRINHNIPPADAPTQATK